MMVVLWSTTSSDQPAEVEATRSGGAGWIVLFLLVILLVLAISLLLLPVYLYKPWRQKFRGRFRRSYRLFLCGNLLNVLVVPTVLVTMSLWHYVERNEDALMREFPEASILDLMWYSLKSGRWLGL